MREMSHHCADNAMTLFLFLCQFSVVSVKTTRAWRNLSLYISSSLRTTRGHCCRGSNVSSVGLQFRVGTLLSATESQLSTAITMNKFMKEKSIVVHAKACEGNLVL